MTLVYVKGLLKLVVAWISGRSYFNYTLYGREPIQPKESARLVFDLGQRVAIVMQGPIIEDDMFTIKTLELYRKTFDKATLILSTWYCPPSMTRHLELIGVNVIVSVKPGEPGIANLNYQIVSTHAGVAKAQELGAEYVLKTRTDQRIYRPCALVHLLALIRAFPLPEKHGTTQVERLIAISCGTFKYRLYGISDMFLFGTIVDMHTYFSIPLQARVPSKAASKSVLENTWKSESELELPETVLSKTFLKAIGRSSKGTLRDSLDVFRNHFVIVDAESVGLYWHKYTINSDRYADFQLADIECRFVDWLALYGQFDKLVISESVLNRPR